MNPRAAYSMLHCVIKPSWSGDTEFADLRDAYDIWRGSPMEFNPRLTASPAPPSVTL